MKLVIGGAFQGKDYYAKRVFSPVGAWIDGADCEPKEIFSCGCICHFQEFVKRCVKIGKSLDDLVEDLMERNPDICIVGDEIGCGVIPAEKEDRIYREVYGRLMEKIAEASDEVHRVFCGLGMVIKGA